MIRHYLVLNSNKRFQTRRTSVSKRNTRYLVYSMRRVNPTSLVGVRYRFRQIAELSGSFVTTAWRVLRLQEWRGKPRMWLTAASILKEQSRTADKQWSSSLEVGRWGPITLTVKKKPARHEMWHRPSDIALHG
jgi:hypothetical protein